MLDELVSAYVIPGIKECYKDDLYGTEARVNRIIERVCDYFGKSPEMVKSKSRRRSLLTARYFCIFFIRKYTNLTLKETAELFGGRDHTTAINSISVIKDQLSLKHDNETKTAYYELVKLI